MFMTLQELIRNFLPNDISITFSIGMFGNVIVRATKNGKAVSKAMSFRDLDNDAFMKYLVSSLISELRNALKEEGIIDNLDPSCSFLKN